MVLQLKHIITSYKHLITLVLSVLLLLLDSVLPTSGGVHHSRAREYRRRARTCFSIPAAISWLQSKMMWNSFPLFISFSSGLASFDSRGSCRIFKRMLYRDGALISSCSRIRPARENQKDHSFPAESTESACASILGGPSLSPVSTWFRF